jgi:hypothetical protein
MLGVISRIIADYFLKMKHVHYLQFTSDALESERILLEYPKYIYEHNSLLTTV